MKASAANAMRGRQTFLDAVSEMRWQVGRIAMGAENRKRSLAGARNSCCRDEKLNGGAVLPEVCQPLWLMSWRGAGRRRHWAAAVDQLIASCTTSGLRQNIPGNGIRRTSQRDFEDTAGAGTAKVRAV